MFVKGEVISYLSQIILKSGEQLAGEYTSISPSLIDISIVRSTARTLRQAGIITLSMDIEEQSKTSVPDESLLRWSPGKRAVLEDNGQTFEWLTQGWIIKEMRLKQDGKTMERVHYRMGYRLFQYLQNKTEQGKRELLSRYREYQQDVRAVLSVLRFENKVRESLLSPLLDSITASLQWSLEELTSASLFPLNWSGRKRIEGLYFLLAFLSLASRKEVFDWKEIGARYFHAIGGSKAFDEHKDDFLQLVETRAGVSVEALGVISPGKITPLFFAGHLSGRWSSYQPGPVHALTDLSIAQDQYRTDATTLWLVENRAVLTRMAAERGFIQETSSLIVCVDGHLRGSHKSFIRGLLRSSTIQQAILWSDYDKDGLRIAHELAQAVSGEPLTVKWICHNHRVTTDWQEYQLYLEPLLQEAKLEQELVLGEAEDWRCWINH